MKYGCPQGHTDGIEQGCQLTSACRSIPKAARREQIRWTAGKPITGARLLLLPSARSASIIWSNSEQRQKTTHNKRDKPAGLLCLNLMGGTSASAD
jgi:hypothetical protein